MGWRGILGFEYGIVQAPLGPDISCPKLVAAVANAGALGFLRAPDSSSPDFVRELIKETRSLTDKPFGVGVVLSFPNYEENIKAILDERVAVLQVYWGECSRQLVDQAHSAGVKIVHQVGNVEEARKAIDVGVDAIMVQGKEAGGHVIGHVWNFNYALVCNFIGLFERLISLLPRVVDIVGERNIPIIAAGSIVDSRGYVAALALGAHAIALGTRFVATEESNAHLTYKRKLIEFEKTSYTHIFGRARWPNAPHRVLNTPLYEECKLLGDQDVTENGQPIIGHSIISGKKTEIRRLSGTVPNKTTEGDIENMVMYAGEGVGLIEEILPAAEVVKRLVNGAQLLIHKLQFSP